MAETALRAAVGRLDDGNRLVAFYHFGWSDAQGRPAAASSGKALRPILALLSARAARVPQDVGLPGAVSVELVHNFALLHDDLMDGDRERRHRATAWTVFGPARAILAGDAMLALAHQVLLEVPGPMGAAAARLLADTSQLLIRGQAEDLSFESRSEVSVDECLAMASGKTSALLACAAAVGAQLAGSEEIAVGLHRYGWHLGLAFQLVDDLLGIWGDPAETGKPVLSDLRKRKKSLPVTAALASGGPAAEELAEWLGRPTRDRPGRRGGAAPDRRTRRDGRREKLGPRRSGTAVHPGDRGPRPAEPARGRVRRPAGGSQVRDPATRLRWGD